MDKTVIFGPDGKEISSIPDKNILCPKCGSGANKRVPSGGFGQTWLVCLCGYEFKELICPNITP